eukprot:scaffold48315_cov64-Phaeocystis_antarctica.AAC.7
MGAERAHAPWSSALATLPIHSWWGGHRVVARAQLEHLRDLGWAVHVEDARLDPGVVRVAPLVDVATVDHLALGEERVAHGRELRALLGVGDVAGLLRELAPHGRGDLLVVVDHATGQTPLSDIPALDRYHLQPPLVSGVPPSHDRICGVVAAPLAKQASIGHARAAARVERSVLLVEAEGALVRDPLTPVLRPEPANLGVRPPARLRGAVVLGDLFGGVDDRLVRGPRH